MTVPTDEGGSGRAQRPGAARPPSPSGTEPSSARAVVNAADGARQGRSGPHHDRLVVWALAFGVWTFLGVLATVQYSIAQPDASESLSFTATLAWQMPQWYLWAMLMPVIVGIDRRFRPGEPTFRRALLVHAPVAVVAVLLHSAFVTRLNLFFFGEVFETTRFVPAFVGQLRYRAQFEFLTYLAIVGAWYAFDYFRRHQRDAVRASRLEAALANSELRALKMQLQPHFLFNTIQAVAVLNRRSPDDATRVLQRLGDLFRYVLRTSGAHEVLLGDEIDFVDRYLAIERLRFQDRLELRFDIEPATRDAVVPHFILQPLVENAIKHGVSPKVGPGRVEIRSRREGETLVLEVVDDGVGPSATGVSARDGVGLSNTRSRLAHLYGPAAGIELRADPDGGTVATARLPFRSEPLIDAGEEATWS